MAELKECHDRDDWLVRVLVELRDPMWQLVEVAGEIDKSKHPNPYPWLSIGFLEQNPGGDYPLTWRGRLTCAWGALRGRLWAHNLEVYKKEDAQRIADALQEVINRVWPEEDD